MTISWFPKYPILLTLCLLKDLPKQGEKLKNGPELAVPINTQWQKTHGQKKLQRDLPVNHIKMMFAQHLENGYKTLNLAKRSHIHCSELSVEYRFWTVFKFFKKQSQKKPSFLV